MDPLAVCLAVYRSADRSAAFRALVDNTREDLPVHCAAYIDSQTRTVRECWPPDVAITDDLVDTGIHVLRPEVFALGSEFPFDAAVFPSAEVLLLPLHKSTPFAAVCLLIAEAGSFSEDMQPWEEVAAALQDVEERHRRVAAAEATCEELRRRTEESESLHTLGLAANRTLNKDEVLNLVARFTRTLLGAHYVTVNTGSAGLIHTVASVGLRDAARAASDYHLARSVVEAEKPLTVGGADANLRVDNFPVHAAEGMKVGLGIPLSLFGDTFGALIVGYRRDYLITPRDIRLAMTLAGHAAVAISNARLHAAVEERSEQLATAYQELNALSEAKERFFASINHELRNPLGAILGYHTLLLEGTVGEISNGARPWLEKANRAATTLRTLVNDILDLSKIAAGKMELDLRSCTLREILDGVLNTLQPLADEKKVSIDLALDEDLPQLLTDPDRVQQILVNLLSNALKFTGPGGVRITATGNGQSAVAIDGVATVEIRVTDTGTGISGDDLRRIFEEYEQVKGTKGGTGLGLPISRRLARALGGDLWAESEMGVGSTFVLTVPADVSAEALVSNLL